MSIIQRRGSINTGSVDTRPGIQNRGFWNATTNTTTDSSFPSLASGIGTKNYYYVVSVAGTTNLDGNNEWEPNDWALFDGTVWEKIDNSEAGSGDVNGPASAVNNNIATYNSTSGKIIKDGGSKIITEAEGITGNDNDASVPTAAAVKDFVDNNSGSGDVTGPASSTDSNVALFDGSSGKIIKDGGALGALATLNSVSATEIDSGAVDTDELASNSVTDAKVATGIDAVKIGAGNVDNTEFGYLDGTNSAIQTQIDSKLAEANSIFMPDYTKYCVDNRDDLATVIASITNEATVVNISQGSFGGATPLSINKDNIALIAPPSTPAMVEFAYQISTATTADRIRMRYLSFDADFNAGSKRSTYNHCTFNEDLNIQTSATAGYMTFANCEFAAGKTISVQNTYASVVYFINCNFAGCSFSLNQASATQVIFSNCAGFVSFPTNATYTHTNILTTGFSQNSVTKTLLATGSGTSGQVLTSGGAGLPDTWVTPSSSSGDVAGPGSSTDNNIASFDGATGKIIQDGGITTASISSAISQTTTNTANISSNTTAIAGKASSGSNSDITALTGLTTALSVAQGGTGATTASAARTSLGLGSLATQSSVTDTDIAAGVNADKISSGSVSNTEFDYLDGVTSSIQTQIDAKGTGDVTGPSSSTSNNVAAFDGTTGKIIKDSGKVLDDIGRVILQRFTSSGTGNVTAPSGSIAARITAYGGGGGGAGGGFSFFDGTVDSYTGGGGGGGASGEMKEIYLPVSGGSTVFYYDIGTGGAGGAGQSAGVSAGDGSYGNTTEVGIDSALTRLLLSVNGSAGGYAPTGSGSGSLPNGGGGGESMDMDKGFGGGGGNRGIDGVSSGTFGNGGMGGTMSGEDATSSGAGAGGYQTSNGGTSGGGGAGFGGGNGGSSTAGTAGTLSGGGGGGSGGNSSGSLVNGYAGGAGGAGYISIEWQY